MAMSVQVVNLDTCLDRLLALRSQLAGDLLKRFLRRPPAQELTNADETVTEHAVVVDQEG